MPRSRVQHFARTCLLAALLAADAQSDGLLPGLRINGLAVDVTQLSGTEGASRIAALESQWRSQPNTVLPWQQHGEWRVLAHRTGRWSEVLQVRGRGADTEAFLSRLDVERAPAPVPVLPLPPGCRAGSTVESGESNYSAVQVTGPCVGSPVDAFRAWSAGLVAAGWRGGVQANGSIYRFLKGGDEFVVVFPGTPRRPAGEARAFTALRRQLHKEDGP